MLGNDALRTDYAYYDWTTPGGQGRLEGIKTGARRDAGALQKGNGALTARAYAPGAVDVKPSKWGVACHTVPVSFGRTTPQAGATSCIAWRD